MPSGYAGVVCAADVWTDSSSVGNILFLPTSPTLPVLNVGLSWSSMEANTRKAWMERELGIWKRRDGAFCDSGTMTF